MKNPGAHRIKRKKSGAIGGTAVHLGSMRFGSEGGMPWPPQSRTAPAGTGTVLKPTTRLGSDQGHGPP